ncbi:MAG TPA: adenylate/guanylate cyclase domain-containing protein [Candidatus Ozemobacteraceae bacterium]|nr:adenylate/guanylate cyclase domain-containing protein [Candidatus Ozemobacteraceae bacterium]
MATPARSREEPGSVLEHHGRFLTIIYIDANTLSPDFVPRLLAATWRYRDADIAYLPSDGTPPLLSPGLSRRSELCRRLEALRPLLGQSRFRFQAFERFAIGAARAVGGTGRLVCLAPIRHVPDVSGGWARTGTILLYLLLTFTLIGFFRTSGAEYPVRLLVMVVFLAAAILPLSCAGYLSSRFIAEYYRERKQGIADSLHAELTMIDENGRHNLASYTSYLKSLDTPAAFGLVQESEASATAAMFERSLTAMRKADDIFLHMFLAIPRAGPHVHLVVNYEDLVEKREKDFVISRFIQRAASRFRRYERNSAVPTSATPEENPTLTTREVGRRRTDGAVQPDPSAPALAGLEKEFVNEMLLRLVGPSTFINLLQYPERVFEMSVLFNTNFILETVIRSPARVSHLVYWFWGSTFLESAFLRATLERPWPAERPGDQNAGLVGFQTDVKYFPERLETMAASFTALRGLLADVQTSRGSIRKEEIQADGRYLMEAFPAKHLKAVLAGQKSLAGLEREHAALATRLSVFVSVLFALALGGGVIAGLYFLLPLQRIIRGIDSIRSGGYGIRLDADRSDEFGSVALAFNRLAQGLEEGRLLRQYVSDSARRMAQAGPEEGRGRTVMATIVFSTLHEFAEFQERNDVRTVFDTLERHLDIVNTALEGSCGEIDKVIGDKIMIVFRHPAGGGDLDAVRSAFGVIDRMRREAAARGLVPGLCIGINTGSVVSGIIGSEDTHLDFTVIGDPVNLTARLAALAQRLPGNRTVVSGATRRLIGSEVAMESLGTTHVKGKTQEIEAYFI